MERAAVQNSATIMSTGARASFFRVGPPGKFQALKKKNKNFKKVPSSQAGGPAQYILTAIPNHRPSI